MTPYAHSGRDATGKPDLRLFQPLAEHLRAVATGAELRARAAVATWTDLAAAARLAGLLHDLGKYRPEFQLYIRKDPCYQKGNPLTRHKEAGAAVAFDANHNALALAILGHHGGIPDGSTIRGCVKDGKPVADAIRTVAEIDCGELRSPYPMVPQFQNGFVSDLFTRMLFSCLVDADWTDTGAHERHAAALAAALAAADADWTDTGAHERRVKNSQPEPDPPALDPAARLVRVEAFIAGRANRALEARVKQAREDVRAACLAEADSPPGLFSLTVPTGGGKTLAALAFALKHAAKHAAKHGLRRVIYVAPYMTILEQNADVIRAALGVGATDPAVFEHYSLADPVDENPEETGLGSAARRAENWDAPIVVTTNVQFFESLFSNKPGRCRKVHNIARSVIVLDECQTLPPGLVAPTCGMLKQLSTDLGCSIVLCTATQPAFDHDTLKDDERLTAREIIPAGLDLFASLKRVTVTWPKPADPPLSWAEVAEKMRAEPAALCVVNTKKAARAVYDELAKGGVAGVFHLSTGMCPQHRREKLTQIRGLLDAGAPCYVVSTQLIEAGVDVDFPFLMRELAPLESVIQAAGRCNREGKLASAGGRVVVFRSRAAVDEPRKYYPQDEWYTKGRSVLETDFLNDDYEPQIDRPEDIQKYYRKLYCTGRLDKHSIQAKRIEEKFATVAQDYKLIKDDTVPVVVAEWESHRAEIASLLAQIKKEKRPRKALFRRLALFQVNVWRRDIARLQPHMTELTDQLLVWTSKYDETVGIVEEIGWDAIV